MFYGKLIGFFLGGLLLHGFWGAIFGLWIGHLVDKRFPVNRYKRAFRGKDPRVQQLFFDTTFLMMGHLAKADGKVSQEEIQHAETIMAQMALTPEMRSEAIRLFQQGKAPDFDWERRAIKLREFCASHPVLLQLFLDIQVRAAFVEGFSHAKQQVLSRLYQILGIQPMGAAAFEWIFQQARQGFEQAYHQQQQTGGYARTQSSGEDPYTVLGVSRQDDEATIKQRYRKLMSEHHPDKLIAQGLPESMIAIATEKTKRIQRAYAEIRKQRGK